MRYWAYLFEARPVQGYILDSADFADLTSAGERIERLCRETLNAALDNLGLERDAAGFCLTRRCTGRFEAVLHGAGAETAARRLRDLWSLAAPACCPGPDFLHGLGSGATPAAAIAAGQRELLRQARLPAAHLPEIPPIVRRDPRSGRAVIASPPPPTRTGTAPCLLDQDYAAFIRLELAAPEGAAPVPEIEPEPWLRQRRAAFDAAAEALAAALRKAVPAGTAGLVHPLLLGDSEVLLLAPAASALALAADLLAAFERTSARLPPDAHGAGPATAGVLFFRTCEPMLPADRLLRVLCAQARLAAGGAAPSSALAFGRLDGGVQDLSSEETGSLAYGAGRNAGTLPPWDRLDALAALLSLEDMAFGPARRLLALLRRSGEDAARDYRHWRARFGKALPERLGRFDDILGSLGIPKSALPLLERKGRSLSPVEDAWLLCTCGHRSRTGELP